MLTSLQSFADRGRLTPAQPNDCDGQYKLSTSGYLATLNIRGDSGIIYFGRQPEQVEVESCRPNSMVFVRYLAGGGNQRYTARILNTPSGRSLNGTWSGTGGNGTFVAVEN